ncbi:MAG: NADPH-dependent F420 reductase [Steroidobacteraceae bacterium]
MITSRCAVAWRRLAVAAVAGLWACAAFGPARAAAGRDAAALAARPQARTLRIGIIGAGHMGGTLAALWAKAGYAIMISSRHPAELEPLARKLGPKVRVGTPREAAVFGNVVVVSVPYGALPALGRELERQLAGKVVIDTGNPYPSRDGPMAVRARREGTGIASAGYPAGHAARPCVQRHQLDRAARPGASPRRARGDSDRRR